jgi:hypothetical protein
MVGEATHIHSEDNYAGTVRAPAPTIRGAGALMVNSWADSSPEPSMFTRLELRHHRHHVRSAPTAGKQMELPGTRARGDAPHLLRMPAKTADGDRTREVNEEGRATRAHC